LIHVYIYGALIIDAILSNIDNESNPLYGKGEEMIIAYLIIGTLYFIYDKYIRKRKLTHTGAHIEGENK